LTNLICGVKLKKITPHFLERKKERKKEKNKIMKNIIVFSSLFLCFFITTTSAQEKSIKISGKIISDNDLPLGFANITIKHTDIGTASNALGDFILNIPQSSLKDSVQFSYLGCYTKTLRINDLIGKKNIIILPSRSLLLEGLIIRNLELEDNPKRIVKNMVGFLKNQPIDSGFIQNFYFRRAVSFKEKKSGLKTWVQLHEAAISRLYKKEQIDTRIVSRRRSQDFRKYSNSLDYVDDKMIEHFKLEKKASRYPQFKAYIDSMSNAKSESEKNLLRDKLLNKSNNILSIDILSQNKEHSDKLFEITNFALNDDFVKMHKFKLDSVAWLDTMQVYIIKILPKGKSISLKKASKHTFVPVGKIYINTIDFSPVQFEYAFILNPRKQKTLDYLAYKTTIGSIEGMRFEAKFQKTKGSVFPYYMMYRVEDKSKLGSNIDKFNKNPGYYNITYQFFSNQIVSNSEAFKKICSKFKTYSKDIYGKKSKNEDSQFWKNYNYIPETPEEEKMRQDLEKALKAQKKAK
jgi:hypothetical protein